MSIMKLLYTCSCIAHIWDSSRTYVILSVMLSMRSLFCFGGMWYLVFWWTIKSILRHKITLLISFFYWQKYNIHCCKFTNRKPEFVAFSGEIRNYIQSIQHSVKPKATKMIVACTLFNIYIFCNNSSIKKTKTTM